MAGRNGFSIVLVSTFEGGFQPLTVACAAAHLMEAGFEPRVLDVYIEGLDESRLRGADFVGIAAPLFDSLIPALEVARLAREVSPGAHVCFFGQYATINAERLVGIHADSCIRGEWEMPLTNLVRRLAGEGEDHRQCRAHPGVSPPVPLLLRLRRVQEEGHPHPSGGGLERRGAAGGDGGRPHNIHRC